MPIFLWKKERKLGETAEMFYNIDMTEKFAKITPFIRPHYLEIEGYVSAGMLEAKDESKIFLNANENPYPLPGLEGYERYPEPQPPKLLDGMAKLYGTSPENIAITRGADEAITHVIRVFCEPGEDGILINTPAFGVYKVYADVVPVKNIIRVPLKKENGTFALDIAGIEAALNKKENRIKVIFLTNPNNPTGTLFPQEDLLAICKLAEGKAMVVIDETYIEFTDQPSMVARLGEFPHVVILRTFSKSYALAGMRVGCFISGVPELIQLLRTKVMETYPIPRGSVEAALKILEPAGLKWAREKMAFLNTERERVAAFFKTQNAVKHVYPSAANFLMVEMDRPAEFQKFASENKIILRDFSKAPGSEGCLRISIGTPEQNDLMMGLFKKFHSKAAA